MKPHHKNPWLCGLFSGLAYVSLTLTGGFAQNANLLRNPAFLQSDGQKVTDWLFSTWNLNDKPEELEQFTWGVEADGDGKALFFSTGNPMKGHMWWQQTVAAVPGETYVLSVSVKSTLEARKYGGPNIGIYFLGENDEWLGIQEIKDVEFDTGGNWITVRDKATAPDNAVKIGVRLGALFDGMIHIAFKDVEFGPE